MLTQTKSTGPVKVNLKEFVASSKRNVSRVNNRLDDYLKNSNEKNIHDIRTAVRRLESSYKALPQNMQKKNKIKQYVSKCKDLFRLNSKIRDYDIITKKIQQHEQHQNVDIENCKKRLASRREAKLREARALALEVRKMSVPKLNRDNISNKKLTKRYNKVVSRFANKILLNVPIVIADPEKLKELHEIRKDCKKLRYLLELLPVNNSSRKGGDVSQLLQELEKMQYILGEIHDCDAVISYLKRQAKRPKLNEITNKIIEERSKKYEEFRTYCKADIENNQNYSLLLKICSIT